MTSRRSSGRTRKLFGSKIALDSIGSAQFLHDSLSRCMVGVEYP